MAPTPKHRRPEFPKKLVGVGTHDNKLQEALISKYVKPSTTAGFDRDLGNNGMTPPVSYVNGIATRSATRVVDADNMLQTCPDLKLAIRIYISSILAPQDMVTSELTVSCKADDIGEPASQMLKVIRDFFLEDYDLLGKLEGWMTDALFLKGSHPIIVIPESAINEIINGNVEGQAGLESHIQELLFRGDRLRGMGLLGPTQRSWKTEVNEKATKKSGWHFGFENLLGKAKKDDFSTGLEGFVDDDGHHLIQFTDNIEIVKMPDLLATIRESNIRDAYRQSNVNFESFRVVPKGALPTGFNEPDKAKAPSRMYNSVVNRQFSHAPVHVVKTLSQLKKKTVGHPMVFHAPPESCAVVHVPEDPKNHLGYLFIVDEFGSFVRMTKTMDHFAEMKGRTNVVRDMTTQLLAQTRRNQEGVDYKDPMLDRMEMQRLFEEVIEEDFRSRAVNGKLGPVEITKPELFMNVMMTRALQRKRTQLLFIPLSLVTYFAYEYDDYGNGVSLFEKTKIVGSVRSMLLFANSMVGMKNAIQQVELGIELPPNDPDPDRTIDTVIAEHIRRRVAQYPIGGSNPLDQIDYIQNAGLRVKVTGHPAYMETNLSLTESQSNYQQPSTELSDDFRKQQYMGIGIPPEIMDQSQGIEYVTSYVNTNAIFAKQCIMNQKITTDKIDDHARKFTINSQPLMDDLREIVEGNRDKLPVLKDNPDIHTDDIVMHFIDNIHFNLPKPNMSQLKMQMEAFDLYSESLDKVIDAFMNTTMFDASSMGDLNGNIDLAKAVFKASLQRRFLTDRGIMPEVFEIALADDDNKPMLELLETHKTYMDSLTRSLVGFLKSVQPVIKTNNEILQNLQNPPEENSEQTSEEDQTEEETSPEEPEEPEQPPEKPVEENKPEPAKEKDQNELSDDLSQEAKEGSTNAEEKAQEGEGGQKEEEGEG